MLENLQKLILENGESVEYSIPVLITGYGAFYYLCDRDPTSSEPACYTDIPDFLYYWQNQTSGEVWWCQDNTSDAMVFAKTITNLNLPEYLPSKAGAYLFPTRVLNTVYTPSMVSDTQINVSVDQGNLLAASIIDCQVNDGSGYNTVAIIKTPILSAGAASKNASFIVAKGKSYKLLTAGGTNTLTLVSEITLN